MELVTRVKKDFPKTPIVLMTAHGNEELAIQVLQAGAANYVPKKKLAKELHSALDEVLSNVRSEKNHQIVRSAIASHEVQFEIENDISHVSPLVSHIEQLVGQLQFFEPGSMLLIGVALHEALTNAILHGNLELDSTGSD
ncbi:MAG: response regulator [Actinobacteria bacterium]|nr:response regulator [Actinomycetota bacterium]